MAVYCVVGRLGTGKTKFCVYRALQALLAGRRVASNVDLQTHLLVPRSSTSYTRIPDKPTAFDLEAMGHGNADSYDEEKNGVLILDELGTWLNSRSFQDKGRAAVLDWLIHARKHGWDVYLIVQDVNMIDRQVRDGLVQYECNCLRFDKLKIPVIGFVAKRWLKGLHQVSALMVLPHGQKPVLAERWRFYGEHLHAAYDTRQVFRSDYPHGAHSVLPPWDWAPAPSWSQRMRQRLAELVAPAPRPALKPKARLVQLLQELPPDQRLSAWRRFHLAGRV